MDLKYIDTARDELTRIVRGAIDELTMPAIAEVINEIVAQTKEIT
jgi:hypothetical protein